MSIQDKSDKFLWAKEKSLDFFVQQIQEHFPNDPSSATEDELVVGMSIEACNHEEYGLRVGFQSQKNHSVQIEEEFDPDLELYDLLYWDYICHKSDIAEMTEFAQKDPQMI